MEYIKNLLLLSFKRPLAIIILILSLIILILIITWKWPDLYNSTNEIRKKVLQLTEDNSKRVDRLIENYESKISSNQKTIDGNNAEMLKLASEVVNSKIKEKENQERILELKRFNETLQKTINEDQNLINNLRKQLEDANKRIADLENQIKGLGGTLASVRNDSAAYTKLQKTDSLKTVKFSFDNIDKKGNNEILYSGKISNWKNLSHELQSNCKLTLEIKKVENGSPLAFELKSNEFSGSLEEDKLIVLGFRDYSNSSPFKGHKNMNGKGNGYEFIVSLNSPIYGKIIIGTNRIYFNPLIGG